jgi:hypothetical protein
VSGGDRHAYLTLMANGVWKDTDIPMGCHFSARLVEAKIPVDVILSYRWLMEHQVQVDPYNQGILVDLDGSALFLKGVGRSAALRAAEPATPEAGPDIDTTRMGPAQTPSRRKLKAESPPLWDPSIPAPPPLNETLQMERELAEWAAEVEKKQGAYRGKLILHLKSEAYRPLPEQPQTEYCLDEAAEFMADHFIAVGVNPMRIGSVVTAGGI